MNPNSPKFQKFCELADRVRVKAMGMTRHKVVEQIVNRQRQTLPKNTIGDLNCATLLVYMYKIGMWQAYAMVEEFWVKTPISQEIPNMCPWEMQDDGTAKLVEK